MLKMILLMLGLFLISAQLSVSYFCFCLIFMILSWLMVEGCFFSSMTFFGLDSLSWFLIMLSFWVILLMLISSNTYYFNNMFSSKFSMVMVLMLFLLFLTFSTLDMLSFYIFFEGSLIPIYILIMGWGYQPERLQAGIYLFLYTIMASLPLLISLILMSKTLSGFSMCFLKNSFSFINPGIWFIFSMLAFLVKLPVFYFHLWLPKAHVEAPVSGSMMLAGVLLKLGCYGMMRFMMFFDVMVSYLSSFMVSLGLLGGLSVSYICMRQVDLKSLIAYSSVSHMGLLLAGLGSWGLWGYSGGLYMCVAHGLCSSGLFFMSGVVYDRSGSRSIFINKGLLNLMPSLSFWWFLFCIGNMGAPIALNLIGELSLLGSILSFSFFSIFFLMLFSFMGACYSLFLFSSTQHGNYYSAIQSMYDGIVRDHLVLLLHFFPLVFLLVEVDLLSF
uniref:NADH-ubiquinone oxidoreductase chain 4 n=1 Tax=Glyptelasma annandalei TaxID=2590147 RepID=A0A4Y5UZ84_9CRUS|nr:NADH dehydrogenase subunit 4 [Glyptelasma annandalei]QDD68295.1 NADH dehydrogenase subunit 4 [Glyptelasma annandalei]